MAKYYYAKYNSTITSYTYQVSFNGKLSQTAGPGMDLYSSYSFNNATGQLTAIGHIGYSSTAIREQYKYQTLYTTYTGYGGTVSSWVWDGTLASVRQAVITNYPNYGRGTLVQSNIVAENGTYPANGRHSDGFWYVRGTLANEDPTLTLDTTDNRTLYENDVISISGNAKDINSGNVVSVKYSLNGGTIRAITSAISTGANIPYSKSLTFKLNKLYDGETAVTGDLAEGAQNTLKVWAEDDQGGKSVEQTRTFFVVPNRPASLTISPFTSSSDLIDSDTVVINGTVSDPDGNDIVVKYKIANGSYIEVYSGAGGEFNIPIQLSTLAEGSNTITIRAEDSYGATTDKTVSILKDKVSNPLKTAVARYKLTPPNGSAKGILLWIEREVGDLTVDVKISAKMNGEAEEFVAMTKESTAYVRDGIEEDEFVYDAGTEKENIIIEITMNRTSTASNKGITLISGVLN